MQSSRCDFKMFKPARKKQLCHRNAAAGWQDSTLGFQGMSELRQLCLSSGCWRLSPQTNFAMFGHLCDVAYTTLAWNWLLCKADLLEDNPTSQVLEASRSIVYVCQQHQACQQLKGTVCLQTGWNAVMVWPIPCHESSSCEGRGGPRLPWDEGKAGFIVHKISKSRSILLQHVPSVPTVTFCMIVICLERVKVLLQTCSFKLTRLLEM